MERRGESACLNSTETGLPVGLFQQTRSPQTEGSRLSRQRRWQLRAPPDDRDGQREELVVLGGGIDNGGHPTTWFERAPHVAQCLLLIWEVDQPHARDDGVK